MPNNWIIRVIVWDLLIVKLRFGNCWMSWFWNYLRNCNSFLGDKIKIFWYFALFVGCSTRLVFELASHIYCTCRTISSSAVIYATNSFFSESNLSWRSWEHSRTISLTSTSVFSSWSEEKMRMKLLPVMMR